MNKDNILTYKHIWSIIKMAEKIKDHNSTNLNS